MKTLISIWAATWTYTGLLLLIACLGMASIADEEAAKKVMEDFIG